MNSLKKMLSIILCFSVLGGHSVVMAKKPTVISNNMRIAGTVAVGALSAAASGIGTYLLLKEIKSQGEYREFFKNHPRLIKMAPYFVGLLGGGLGGAIMWFYFKQFAPAGQKERAEEKFKKLIKNGLLDGDIEHLSGLIINAIQNNNRDGSIDLLIIKNSRSSRRALPEIRDRLRLLRKDINKVLRRIELAEENGGTNGLGNLKRRVVGSKDFVDNLDRYISSIRIDDLQAQELERDEKRDPEWAESYSRRQKREAETDVIQNTQNPDVIISSVDGNPDYHRRRY
jgi:hypothetical protein